MGYCYSRGGGLVCDCCGTDVEVRKRTCPHKVDGLPYCSAPAMCGDCYKKHGGVRLHDRCKPLAEEQSKIRAKQKAMLESGHLMLKAGWGDWHELVPSGYVGAVFAGLRGEEWRLIPSEVYKKYDWLHEYEGAVPWKVHP